MKVHKSQGAGSADSAEGEVTAGPGRLQDARDQRRRVS
jgi:hypothetical protein